MNKLKKYRRFLFTAAGILSLVAAVGNSAPASAAQAGSDISVKIVADRAVVRPGQTVMYTVTMTNIGPDDASFVDVGFRLSSQLVLVSMQCDLGISPDTPFCEYSSLPSGHTVVSTLVAIPKSTTRRHQSVVRTVAAVSFETADSFDPHSANNTASIRTRLVGRRHHRYGRNNRHPATERSCMKIPILLLNNIMLFAGARPRSLPSAPVCGRPGHRECPRRSRFPISITSW